MNVSGKLHALAPSPPWKHPITHWIGGWVGPRESRFYIGEEKGVLSLPKFKPRTVKPVAQLIYYATLAPNKSVQRDFFTAVRWTRNPVTPQECKDDQTQKVPGGSPPLGINELGHSS
jgi:hypothetical protein